jgi:membrane protein implicated in regulation of membrane protease activity
MPTALEAFFGIGKVPVTMLWGSLCLGWGLFGIYGTQFWSSILHAPILFAPLAAVTGVSGAILAGRFTAMLGQRLMPDTESFAVSSVGLFGCRGRVVYAVDTEHGRVHVYDVFGTLHDKEARSRSGVIPRGKAVIVLDFNDETDRLIVEEAPDEGRKS